MGLFQNIKQTLSGIAYVLLADSNGNQVGVTSNALNVFQTNASTTPPTTGGVLSQLSITTGSQTVLPINVNRRGFSIYNNSSNFVYIAESGTASPSSFSFAMQPNGYEEITPSLYGYTGIITAIGAATGGNLQVTEFTT